MTKIKVTVTVNAPDVMMASMMQQGVQNVLDELGENQSFLIELANKQTAKGYKDKLMAMLSNPIVKKLAGTFGG